MGIVNLEVNGHNYKLSCDDGTEEYIIEIAKELSDKVSDMVQQVGQIGETRLLLMTSLVLVDELQKERKAKNGVNNTKGHKLVSNKDLQKITQKLEELVKIVNQNLR